MRTVFRKAAGMAAVSIILAWSASPASAGPEEECHQSRETADPRRKIAACTEMIESGDYTGQDLALAYNSRGVAYRELGMYERAIDDYHAGEKVAPEMGMLFKTNRAAAYDRLGRHKMAFEECDLALQARETVTALYCRAAAYSKLGDHQRAVEDVSRALELSPENYRLYFARAVFHQRLGQHREALTDFEKALLEDPYYAEPFYTFAEVYHQRGRSYLELGEPENAVVQFQHAIEHGLKTPQVYNMRAWTLYLLGRPAEAIRNAEQALAGAPDDPYILDTHAHVLAALGRRQEAMAEFERAIEMGGEGFILIYQDALAEQGYYSGPIDGEYDPEMRAALDSCIEVACRLAE